MKIRRPGESLPDDGRAHDFAVSNNQLTVRLVWKNQLRQSSHNEWIQQSEKDGCCNRHQDGDQKVLFHRELLCQARMCNQQVDQLDANKGNDHATETVYEQVVSQQCRRAHRTILHAAQRQRDQRNDDQRIENHR